jgi:hypothetical protein
MRIDNLARAFDLKRCAALPVSISALPALELFRRGDPPLSGSDVANAFGSLAHYTTRDNLVLIRRSGFIGPGGCWLTPTGYSGCMVPYDLGLNAPRDICLVVDVRALAALWGPGTAAPSGTSGPIWRGGGIEFYSRDPIDFKHVVLLAACEGCGDAHR